MGRSSVPTRIQAQMERCYNQRVYMQHGIQMPAVTLQGTRQRRTRGQRERTVTIIKGVGLFARVASDGFRKSAFQVRHFTLQGRLFAVADTHGGGVCQGRVAMDLWGGRPSSSLN